MKCPRWNALLFVILTVGLIAGCGGTSEESGAGEALESAADAAKEAAAGAEEAVEDVAMAAEDLKKKIAEKEAELEKLAEELKGLSPADLAGDKAKELQSRQEALTEELEALKAKLQDPGD